MPHASYHQGMRVALALLLVAAGAVRAENNCGQMEHDEARFRGVVRAVEMIGERELSLWPVELDPRYAVTIEVETVASESSALAAAKREVFGIHSPSRMFGSEDPVGKSFALATVWMQCDGAFGRFLDLRVDVEMVEDYDGYVEVGHTYRATVVGREIEPYTKVPRHHLGGLSWTNADAFLSDDDHRRTVVFHVGQASISQREPGQWLTIYRATILRVE